MKSKILLLTGICFLFFSCSNELMDFQEGSLHSAAMSSSSSDCSPDIEGFELSLPETVTFTTKLSPCDDPLIPGSFLTVDIAEGSLAGSNNAAWCADLDGSIGANNTYTFDVHSSYEDLSGLEKSPGVPLFENANDFDRINWLLNQDIIGTESPNGGTYTFGHIQWAIWDIIEGAGNNCGGAQTCAFLSCNPTGQWNNNTSSTDIRLGGELVAAAAAAGEGFIPQCGEKISIILASTTRQSLIITVDVPEKEEECKDCEGNVTELTLQYNGTKDAYIEVKTKDEGVNGSKIVFEGNVGPGGTFTIYGNDENGTFGDEIKVYVDGDYVKIKTDCSEDIGPGLILEDIEVISGKSSNGAYLCPKACDECEGKVNNLTLQYNGAEDANIRVETKKDGENGEKVVFEGMVEAGAEFSFVGNDKKGTLGTEITIYVNDVVNTNIHTSCSQPIGPGLMSGDFEVISGSSREGGDLCPVDTPPGGGDDCNECKGKVTRLDLTYNGTSDALIQVVQKKDHIIAFDSNVMAGDTFTFYGKDDKGTLGTEIIIYVDGFEAQRIHTSCSVEIGAGSVFGDFTVEGGASREGGEFCPVDTPPTGGGDDCNECDGKITRLDLQYNGAGTNIEILSKKDDIVIYSGNVSTDPEFTINGFDDKGTLGTEIIIKIDGVVTQKIHTSCSVDIGAGSVFGDFTVLGGASRNGGELCPVEPDSTPPASTECECDGKIVTMSVEYSGPNGATITVGDDEDGNNSKSWDNVQKGTILTADLGDIGNWWYWSVNGTVEAAIHTSCSDDILGNVNAHKSTFGNMGIYDDPEDDDENSRNDGTFLVTYHKDGKDNECSLDIAA